MPGLVLTRETCRQQAEAIGPATAAVVGELLEHRPEDRLRSAGRLVRLAEHVGPERLERACARAQVFGAADYPTVKRILAGKLEEEVASDAGGPTGATAPPTFTFARSAAEYAVGVLSGSEATPASEPRRDAGLVGAATRRVLAAAR